LWHDALMLLAALQSKASEHIETVMPGYTHMQPGKPTTFAHWCLAAHDGLARGVDSLVHVLNQFDQNPLGAVESFGTSWPIDRAFTSELLGFSRVWEVPQDAISHRGLFQMQALGAFVELAVTFSKMATDLMLYSTFEYNMIGFGDAVAKRLHPITGSSVMAQKKNPDALELVRAVGPQIAGLYQTVASLLIGLPSGYNRDSREVKEYIDAGISKTRSALLALTQVVPSLQVNASRMADLVDANYSLTTDVADRIAQVTGHPYRLIYKVVGKAVDEAMENGKRLGELSLEDFQRFSQEFGVSLSLSESSFREVLNSKEALSRRKHIGSVNPEITRDMIDDRMAKHLAAVKTCESFAQRIAKSREQTISKAFSVIDE
ncbi:MAG: hypothetical protein KDD53_07000, partial [Bdellovibrionales bacterium]|nr:hypothetical protein [Bdellovibrionales bacterium]